MILRQQFLQHIAQTSPAPLMIEVDRADGIYLYSPDGKRYVDLISGVSVSNVGHNNAKVVEAVCLQAQNYMHTMVYGEMVERPQVEYARALVEALGCGLDSVYFLNSGAEAVEGALKLAKRYTSRSEIISFRNAYHGSTHGAMSVMGGEEFKTAFRPLLPDTRQIEYNSFDDLDFISHRTACVIAEVVQGESGVRPSAPGYLAALRARCTEVGAMLIFDEIQTGFGRCGSMFAFQDLGVEPDILCLAKALGGGMPLGAFIAKREVMQSLTHSPVLGHITTFGGHPVCCAAGLAAFQYIIENKLVENAALQGELFETLLTGTPGILEIRRSGLLMAVELGSQERLMDVMERLLEVGYMSDWFLFCDTAFRISPPLTITSDQVESCCRDIVRVLSSEF